MKFSNEFFKKILVEPGYITADIFTSLVEEAKEHQNLISDVVVERGIMRDDQLGQLIANAIHTPFINLREEKIEEKVLAVVPEVVARAKKVIVFAITDKTVKVGMCNPDDLEIRHFISKRVGLPTTAYYITERDFREQLTRYRSSLHKVVYDILEKLKNPQLSGPQRDKLTAQLIDLLIEYGYTNKASDIHLEPLKEKVVVRFRIDGVMHDVAEVPKRLLAPMLSRIKVLAKMRIDEHFAAQDGKFQFQIQDEKIDVRVSIVPVTTGENAVMRLLSARSRRLSLADIGLNEKDLSKVKKSLKNAFGMVLATGPTGCGKTSTVYGMLKILNTKEVHISTIEDPVEYDIEGISQIQVNHRKGITFAAGLKAIVRQDPDIIMVGEIRDQETADIAVNSAMTGHLVISTMHANDAPTTFVRLIDMGVEPFLVASTVKLVIAQRLVRRICKKCLISYQLTEAEKDVVRHYPELLKILQAKGYGNLDKIRLYKGEGCQACAQTGYQGRIGIFEVLEMTENIKKAIIDRASASQILSIARADGLTTILEDGVDKAFSGITTLSEVLRVAR